MKILSVLLEITSNLATRATGIPLSSPTAKLRNDILMFQQHEGESLSEAWTHFKDLLQKVPHHGIDLWLQVQIFYDHVNPITRRTIDQSAGGKLCDRNAEESWALLEHLALYDNQSWNDLRDFAKPIKAISLPQDVPSTFDRRIIELENQVQRLMEAHLAPKQLVQVNKISSSCEICSGPHDTQYFMENHEQAFVEYASSRTNEVGGTPMAQMNFASTNYLTKEELQGKGIKILSKLLSLKYLSQSSLAEQNRNPSSPKHVHFDHEITVESEEDFEEEIEDEIKEEEEDSQKHFDTFPHYERIKVSRMALKKPSTPMSKGQ
ncbi:hypothetical protein Tco_1460557, partial [Tanacetum coccineum]